jgi:CheY-like chemotaxis protein
MIQRLIGENIKLIFRPGHDLWNVRMDPSQIDQILANLCVNAKDAIPETGTITIETRNTTINENDCHQHAGFSPGDYVCLAVIDNGTGMDADTMSHLFEPFFTTKKTGEGTGLGLATIYGVVKQNQGFLHVHSEPQQGAAFRIYLPPDRRPAGSAQSADIRSLPAPGTETILLVEDEPAILRMTTSILKLLGYTVLPSATPGEALHLAEQHNGAIDLLMTDVIMPEMNGRDLAHRMLSLHPDLKILFMSGYTADVIAHHGVLDPGVQFLQKPFTRSELSERLKSALRPDF